MPSVFHPEKENTEGARATQRVSVIIPVLNEAAVLPTALAAVQRLAPHELIVADGGSADDSAAIARQYGGRVVAAPAGRALQMNAGAEAATGDILLFLHADSGVEPAGYRRMREVMARGDVLGGAFSLAIESDQWPLRLISAVATWRARYLNLVYGDQAIFARASAFRDLQGYSPLPICEDLDFFARLRQAGPVVLLPDKARTSARRWRAEGVWFTSLRNILIAGLFLLGFPPRVLSRWYVAVR